jgi:hypothetical protein
MSCMLLHKFKLLRVNSFCLPMNSKLMYEYTVYTIVNPPPLLLPPPGLNVRDVGRSSHN